MGEEVKMRESECRAQEMNMPKKDAKTRTKEGEEEHSV